MRVIEEPREGEVNRHGLSFEDWQKLMRKRGLPAKYFKDPARVNDWRKGYYAMGARREYETRLINRFLNDKDARRSGSNKNVRHYYK